MPKHNPSLDPEYRRYRRVYPRFPGVPTCLALLRRPNVPGGYWEAVFHDLAQHAPEVVDELIAACHDDANADIRWAILEILGALPAPQALPLFAAYLTAEDESLRKWAARGLAALDTKEARRLLWEARNELS
jgi:hypothetical protein